MVRISKTGILLSVVFLALTAFLERGLLDCTQPTYYCTNILPVMPWYLFLEGIFGFLFSLILNTMILYSIGMYIDKGRNNPVTKRNYIAVFIFLIHLVFSAVFLFLGWMGSTFAPEQGSSELLLSQIMIPVGVIMAIMSFRVLFTKRFKDYIVLAAISFVAIILWMIVVSSYDMIWGLLIYVLLVVPLLVNMHKFNKENN